MTKDHFFPKGVITATLTPLHADLSVDTQALSRHINWLLNHGSQGIALWGTTGEANSFSSKERMAALEALVQKGIATDKLMVGSGCCALPDTIELTKHAIELGAGGILLLPPFYYKQVTDVGLYQVIEKIVTTIDDNRLHIYLYHFPKMSGISFSMDLIERLISDFPDAIVGIKDSSGDLGHMKKLLSNIPGFRVYAGTEKLLLENLDLGGVGCISATANVTIGLIAKVYAHWIQNQSAHLAQERATLVRSLFEGLPFTGALKAYLATHHNNPDWLNIRPPNTIIDSGDLSKLLTNLKNVGFSA